MKKEMKESLSKLWEDIVKFSSTHPYAAIVIIILAASGLTGIHALRIFFMLMGSSENMM